MYNIGMDDLIITDPVEFKALCVIEERIILLARTVSTTHHLSEFRKQGLMRLRYLIGQLKRSYMYDKPQDLTLDPVTEELLALRRAYQQAQETLLTLKQINENLKKSSKSTEQQALEYAQELRAEKDSSPTADVNAIFAEITTKTSKVAERILIEADNGVPGTHDSTADVNKPDDLDEVEDQLRRKIDARRAAQSGCIASSGSEGKV